MYDFNGNKLNANDVVATTNANFVTDAYMYVDDITIRRDGTDIYFSDETGRKLSRIFKVSFSNGKDGGGQINSDQFKALMPVQNGEALMWKPGTDGGFFKQTSFNYGSISVPYDHVCLAYNVDGQIVTGALKSIFDRYFPGYSKPFGRYIDKTLRYGAKQHSVLSSRTFHNLWTDDEYLYTMECNYPGEFAGGCHKYRLSDLSYVGQWATQDIHYTVAPNTDPGHPEGGVAYPRMVSSDYNIKHDVLVIGGSGNGRYPQNMTVMLFYNPRAWEQKGETITMDNVPSTTVCLEDHPKISAITTDHDCKVCWADTEDTIYVQMTNLTHVFEVRLGVGTERLAYGTYNYVDGNRYNGTYTIVNEWHQLGQNWGPKQIAFYKGALYYPLKRVDGGIWFLKTTLEHDGQMRHTVMVIDPRTATGDHKYKGSPEGLVISNGRIISGSADASIGLIDFEL